MDEWPDETAVRLGGRASNRPLGVYVNPGRDFAVSLYMGLVATISRSLSARHTGTNCFLRTLIQGFCLVTPNSLYPSA